MEIREASENDLIPLLSLYTQLHDNVMPVIDGGIKTLWDEILSDKSHHVIVAQADGKIVSSCVIVIVRNLTHGQRPYALIENLITDAAHRNRGLAASVLNYAGELARAENCYKIMLMTGAKDDKTLRFYENAGYNRGDKTAFIQWLE